MSTKPFVITSRCMGRCAYCFCETGPDMRFAEFRERLEEALTTDEALHKIVLTGGDPLLHPDFARFSRYASRRGLRVKATGTYAHSLSPYLEYADEVSIPIDSVIEEEHDSLRGRGDLSNALSALDFFMNHGLTIQVHTVVCSLNLHAINRLHDFLAGKGLFGGHSWKLFRFRHCPANRDYSISDAQWQGVKQLRRPGTVICVDDVLSY